MATPGKIKVHIKGGLYKSQPKWAEGFSFTMPNGYNKTVEPPKILKKCKACHNILLSDKTYIIGIIILPNSTGALDFSHVYEIYIIGCIVSVLLHELAQLTFFINNETMVL